uniref:Uncharacterized protein n=2 Tax=Gibberella zeae TaxID=5518 RepID=A0A4E9EF11_GIBZA
MVFLSSTHHDQLSVTYKNTRRLISTVTTTSANKQETKMSEQRNYGDLVSLTSRPLILAVLVPFTETLPFNDYRSSRLSIPRTSLLRHFPNNYRGGGRGRGGYPPRGPRNYHPSSTSSWRGASRAPSNPPPPAPATNSELAPEAAKPKPVPGSIEEADDKIAKHKAQAEYHQAAGDRQYLLRDGEINKVFEWEAKRAERTAIPVASDTVEARMAEMRAATAQKAEKKKKE